MCAQTDAYVLQEAQYFYICKKEKCENLFSVHFAHLKNNLKNAALLLNICFFCTSLEGLNNQKLVLSPLWFLQIKVSS